MVQFSVIVPKTVQIENNRLGLLLKVMQVLAAFYVVWTFYSMKKYMGTTVPVPGANPWTETGTYYGICLAGSAPADCSPSNPCQKEHSLTEETCTGAGLKWYNGVCEVKKGAKLTKTSCEAAGLRWQESGSVTDLEEEWCDPEKSKQYQYQYGSDRMFSYTDLSCVQLPPSEWSVKGETEMFFTTFFQQRLQQNVALRPEQPSDESACTDETCEGAVMAGTLGLSCPAPGKWSALGKNAAGHCVCDCTVTTSHFVAGVEHLTLAFTHAAVASVSTKDTINMDSTKVGTKDNRENLNLVTTVVRDAETKAPYKTFTPGETIRIRIKDLLAWANPKVRLADMLEKDPVNGLTTGNTYPLLRMTGMTVRVTQVYHNKDDPGHNSDHGTPVCYLEISTNLDWSSKPQVDYTGFNAEGESRSRYRYNYGIKVKFSGYGSYSYIDMGAISLNIAASIVYLSLPVTLITLLAKYGLGGLSKIYENAVNEKLNLVNMFNGLLARSVVAAHVFRTLLQRDKDAGKGDEEEGVLLDATLVGEATHVFASEKGLDQHEVEVLTKSCTKAMRRPDRAGKASLSLGAFLDACNALAPGNLSQMAKFYDKEHSRSCLEAIFDPTAEHRENTAAKVAPAAAGDDSNLGSLPAAPKD